MDPKASLPSVVSPPPHRWILGPLCLMWLVPSPQRDPGTSLPSVVAPPLLTDGSWYLPNLSGQSSSPQMNLKASLPSMVSLPPSRSWILYNLSALSGCPPLYRWILMPLCPLWFPPYRFRGVRRWGMGGGGTNFCQSTHVRFLRN